MIEDRDAYLYLEYDGRYCPTTYCRYFFDFIQHLRFGSMSVIQKTNFTKEASSVLREVLPLYEKHVADYPHLWAMIVPWQIYHAVVDEWHGAEVAPNKKLFVNLDDAENWILCGGGVISNASFAR